MADTEIRIDDRIANTIASKLRSIKGEATAADTAIERLKASLNLGNSAGLLKVANDAYKVEKALKAAANVTYTAVGRTSSLALHTQKLATEEARLARETAKTAQQLERLASSQQRASGAADRHSAALRRQQTSARSAGMAINSLYGYIAGYVGIRTFITAANDAQTLENKIRAMTTSTAQFNSVNEALYKMALNNRVAIADLGTAYQRFRNAMDGVADSKVLRFIDILSKGLVVFGATTGEANSVITQLSQAFNKGKLDGDEFRSVMENFPPLMKAVTTALGVTKEEVYKLSRQGKLNIEALLKAMLGIGPSVDKMFKTTVPTIDQAMEQLHTHLMKFMAENSAASQLLVKAIQWVGENLELVIPAVIAFGIAWGTVQLVTLISQIFSLIGAITLLTARIVPYIAAVAAAGAAVISLAYATATLMGKQEEFENGLVAVIRDWQNVTAKATEFTVASLKAALGIKETDTELAKLRANLDKTGTSLTTTGNGIKTIAGGRTEMELLNQTLNKTKTEASGVKEEAKLAAGELRSISGNASGVYDVKAALNGAKNEGHGLVTELKSISGQRNGVYQVKGAVDALNSSLARAATSAQQTAKSLLQMGAAAASTAGGKAPKVPITLSSSMQNITGATGGGSIQKFATGGSFMVGGRAGRDTNPVGFMATKGEKVTVQTKSQQRAERNQYSNDNGHGGTTVINFNVYANDADSFRRSRAQVAADFARIVK